MKAPDEKDQQRQYERTGDKTAQLRNVYIKPSTGKMKWKSGRHQPCKNPAAAAAARSPSTAQETMPPA
jgi:hypothetical protein